MTSNGPLYFSSSPAVAIPNNAQESYFAPNNCNIESSDTHSTNGLHTSILPTTPMVPTPGSIAGRKRSRGDIHAPEDEEIVKEDGSINAPISETSSKPQGEPIYGPGMTIIYPDDPGYEARPESQSGTWVEERAERNQFQLVPQERPIMTTRKSQRKDLAASGPDDLAQLLLPPQMREVTTEPLIDEATRSLGISWTRMDSTESLQISQAAYAKWIQNHYSGLQNVSVWFENSALPGYLVNAQNAYNGQMEYYVFSHDLTEARLVTSDPSQLLPRLKMLPALHLAAPGGHIQADVDPIRATAAVDIDTVNHAKLDQDLAVPGTTAQMAPTSMDVDMT